PGVNWRRRSIRPCRDDAGKTERSIAPEVHAERTEWPLAEGAPSTYLRVAFNTIPKDVQFAIEQRTGPLDSNDMRAMRKSIDPTAPVSAADMDGVDTTERSGTKALYCYQQ